MEYYRENLEVIYKKLNSSKLGLSKFEVKSKLKKIGLNELEIKSTISPIKIFLNQFKSFIIYILLFAVAISTFLGEFVDATIILIILILNAIIGFIQEFKAQKSIEALKKLNKTISKVYRDNKLIKIDAKKLVRGDIIFLEAGDRVPGDCRIIECSKLKVNESSLTGESLPVKKDNLLILNKVSIGDRKNVLFSSTTIIEGVVLAIICETGMKTEIGKITGFIINSSTKLTPLQKKLDKFGKKLGIGIIFICIFIFFMAFIREFLINGFSIKAILNLALISVALAVAAVPTALPAVVTIALSIGVKNLLKKRILVKKLSSVETLGSCNVICTDKTGTLTKNEMSVKSVWDLNGEIKIEGIGYLPQGNILGNINLMLFKIGAICNNSSHYKEKGIYKISGDPTEAALLVSAKKAKINLIEKREDELPFDSVRKLMSVLIKKDDEFEMLTKGSCDELLNNCSYVLIDNKKIKITEDIKNKILKQNEIYSKKSMRVLGFAYKKINSKNKFIEKDLIFVGLQAMVDPAREDVIDAIKKTKNAGIRVIMITGDHQITALAIAKEVGIEGVALTGADLDEMTIKDIELKLSQNTNIFARVSPEHKLRIITALQNQKNIVAMTGDGVNDAPALNKANIGIAMNSGTEVAKEASDFVLLDNSFANIVDAIEEGRGIYDNIQKSIMLLLSGNLGEVLIIFLAIILGFNLPLTAVLLLWINFITDGAPALAFSVDPYAKNIMERKPKKTNSNILPSAKLYLIGILGIVGSLIGLILFAIYGGNNLDNKLAQTMIFNFVVLYEIILVFIIRKQFGVKLLSNIWIWWAILISIIAQLIIMYSPLRELFGIVELGFSDFIYLIIAGGLFYFSYLVYDLIIKKFKLIKSFN